MKKLGYFITHPTSSRTAGILLILVIAASVPLTVFIAQKQQELRQRAASPGCNPPYENYMGCLNDAGKTAYETSDPSLPLYCTGSCQIGDSVLGKDDVFGQYCYKSTKVGNNCTNDAGEGGTCSEQGNCIAIPASAPTTYTIYGFVFYDKNKTGQGANDPYDNSEQKIYFVVDGKKGSQYFPDYKGYYTVGSYAPGTTHQISLTLDDAFPGCTLISPVDRSITVSSGDTRVDWPIVCKTSTPTLAPRSTPFPTSPPDECSGNTDCRVSNPCVKGTCEYNIDKGNRECKYESTNVSGACEYSPNYPYQPIKFCDSSGQCVASAPTLAPGVPTSTPTSAPVQAAQPPPAAPPATTKDSDKPCVQKSSVDDLKNKFMNGFVTLEDLNSWASAYATPQNTCRE